MLYFHLAVPSSSASLAMVRDSQPAGVRFSLREFLLMFGAIAVGFTALKYANAIWLAAVGAVVMLAFMAQAVTALVDRGSRQAFALGFVACLASYLSIFFVETEMHPYQARFPTSILLRHAFESLREQLYLDETSGEGVLHSQLPPGARTIRDFSWTITPPPSQGGALMAPTPQVKIRTAPSTGTTFRRIGDVPSRDVFMPIGHLLWALFFGYWGGQYGRLVYARSVKRQTASISAATALAPTSTS
jgi:hypothetical protein